MPDSNPQSEEEYRLSLEGEVVHLPALCPHRGGLLKYGYVNSKAKRITCPLHGATFDLSSGRRICGAPCDDLAIESGDSNHVG